MLRGQVPEVRVGRTGISFAHGKCAVTRFMFGFMFCKTFLFEAVLNSKLRYSMYIAISKGASAYA